MILSLSAQQDRHANNKGFIINKAVDVTLIALALLQPTPQQHGLTVLYGVLALMFIMMLGALLMMIGLQTHLNSTKSLSFFPPVGAGGLT